MTQIIVTLLIAMVPLNLYAGESPYGIFITVQGDVTISTQQIGSETAKVGAKIFPGSMITTGADSGAKIVMSDKNIIHIGPDSVLNIDKYENDFSAGVKNVSLILDQGKVRADVEEKYDGDKNQFLIHTPDTVAGVRGTQFMSSYDPVTKTSEIVTFRGLVSFSNRDSRGKPVGPSTFVKEGHTSSAAHGSAPRAARPMHPEELKKAAAHFAISNSKKPNAQKKVEKKPSENNTKPPKRPKHH